MHEPSHYVDSLSYEEEEACMNRVTMLTHPHPPSHSCQHGHNRCTRVPPRSRPTLAPARTTSAFARGHTHTCARHTLTHAHSLTHTHAHTHPRVLARTHPRTPGRDPGILN